MSEITFDYPFDPTGTKASNKITGEKHVLSPPAWKDYHFIIPKMAPFFKDSIKLRKLPSGDPLVEGVDYIATHLFHDASLAVAKPVYGSITFYDKVLDGVVEIVEYQTIGGEWTVDEDTATEVLVNNSINPRITTWEQVVETPREFPVIDHQWHLDDMVGMTEVEAAILRISQVLLATGDPEVALDDHLMRTDNPHETNKGHVGLGSVDNFPTADKLTAEAGESNAHFMTPRRTKQAIEALAHAYTDEHEKRDDNPHGTTKSHVGLSAVQNYPMATQTEAERGESNQRYMSPLRTKQAIDAAFVSFQEHIDDEENPHGTTAKGVGAYSTTEIDQMFESLGDDLVASNATKFGGKTPEEWEAELNGTDDLQQLMILLDGRYSQATSDLGLLAVPTFEEPVANPTVSNVFAGYANTAYLYNDGTVEFNIDASEVIDFGGDDIEAIFNVALGDTAVYLLNSSNEIKSYGVGAYNPPTDFGGKSLTEIWAGRNMAAVRDEDENITAWGDPLKESFWGQLNDTVGTLVSAVVVGNTDNGFVIHNDETIEAFGHANFITNANAIFSGYTKSVANAVIGRTSFLVHFIDDEVKAYSVVDPEGAATITEETLPSELRVAFAISGNDRTFGIVDTTGTLTFWGEEVPNNTLDYPLIDLVAVGASAFAIKDAYGEPHQQSFVS